MTEVETAMTEMAAVVTVVDVAVVAIKFGPHLFHKKPIAGSLQLSVFLYVL
jgi:hypothetical protein